MKRTGLIIALICLLLAGCSKEKKNETYGVSISAPSIVGTAAEAFSKEQIEFFKMANGLSFAINREFAKSDTLGQNTAFSALLLIRDLCVEQTEFGYLYSLFRNCNLADTNLERVNSNLNSLQEVFRSIDSTLIFSSQSDSLDKGTVLRIQRFSLSLQYEEALNTYSEYFSDMEFKKTKRNFFKLFGNFNCLVQEAETVVDIPVGNGNYSLMLIMPNQKDVRSYAEEFTEGLYGKLSEGLEKRMIGLCFPTFENYSTKVLIPLPKQSSDTLSEVKTKQIIQSEITIRQPNEAFLQTLNTSLEEKIIHHAENKEEISFNRPFLFILRGSSSKAIILQGQYLQ